MELVGRTVAGRYKILSLLGKGGMGAVYEAEQTDLRRRVAVKVLTRSSEPEHALRFKQEALAAAGLAHPNIVQVIDFIEGDEPVLVMELLRGKSLSAIVREAGKLEPARAVSLMTQVLSALSAAHEARIVHRDVKPENIFVCASPLPYELVKVLDFGLARPLDESRHIIKTRMGVAMGTPAYMSPEQARGETADVRMDVFAAGVTLYYALAGRRPFDGKTASELLNAVKKQPPIPLDAVCPDLDLDLVRIVERSLSKDPNARFSSAREFLEALTPHWPKANAPAPPPRSVPAKETQSTQKTAGRKRPSFIVGPFETIAPAIAVGMASVARFAHDGQSALAVGPAGLAKWTSQTGWSGRDLPSEVQAALVRGIAFGESGEAVLFGEGFAWVRAGTYARIELPEGLTVHGAHVAHASHVALAGTRLGYDGRALGEDAVVVDCSPAGPVEHAVARGYGMQAVTRTHGGTLVACGGRGTLCSIASGKVHAHVTGRAAFAAIAPMGEGFVAVGAGGAIAHARDATSSGILEASVTKLADDDLVCVRTRAKFLCAAGRELHVASIDALASAATAPISGTIRDVWLGNGVVRDLLDTAAVLEAAISAGL